MNIDEELDKARSAVYSVTDSLAWSASRAAKSAYSAASSAYWSAYSASRAASLEERQKQVEMIKDIL